jgi:hypothetical protein
LSHTLVGCALVAIVAGVARASVGPEEQAGIFALLGGTPEIVSQLWTEHAAGLTAILQIRQFQLDGTTPVLNYDVDMEKLMHLVIVRDDFTTFAHLHPAFNRMTGIFQQRFTKEPNHRYYVYADTMPHDIGQQVFRFTMDSDGPLATSQPALNVSAPSVLAGPYRVTLARTTLVADQEQTLDLTVLQSGRPASGLSPYLGAAAHAVFIDTSTLAYVHLHPTVRGVAMTMNMRGPAGPFMQMELPALPAGTYKLWIQFRGANSRIYTAPFTVLAQ